MKWELRKINQETDHPFLNFFTFEYEVEKQGQKKGYCYYVASRRPRENLLCNTGDFRHGDGVLIAAIKEGDEPSVLLIRQFRPALNTYVIELPAGLCDPADEDLSRTASRECIEETGVELEEVTVLCPPSPTSTGLSDELVGVVMGKVKSIGEKHLEAFEDIQARFFSLSEARALLEDEKNVMPINVRLILLYLIEKYRK